MAAALPVSPLRLWRWVTIAMALSLAIGSAQLPTARLDSLFPFGAKAGTSVEVTAGGAELDEPQTLLADHPGITATYLDGTRFKVDVAQEVRPGAYELRFVGRWGVTMPRHFVVSDRDEVVVPGDAVNREKAPALSPGTVFNGTVVAGNAHFFAIEAAAGKRMFIDCYAERIGSRLDASLVLFDPSGGEVARSREAVGGDPLIDFTPAADGRFVLRVADFLARGGVEYGYRLELRNGPHIDHVLPLSAEPGKAQTFQIFGRNLPGGSASSDGLERIEMTVDVPAEPQRRSTAPVKPYAAGTRGFHLRVGSSNPVFVTFSTAPPSVDAGANAAVADSQVLTLPAEVSGQFNPGATEWFGFDAIKGRTYVVEAFAQRAGVPSDPVLEVFKAGDPLAKLGQADDESTNLGGRGARTNHRDPSYRFTADADGPIRVALRDQFGTGTGFRLALREARPAFDLLVTPPPPAGDNNGGKRVFRTGTALRRGQAAAFRVMALRRDGFGGEIALAVSGLPEGIKAMPATVPAGSGSAYIVLLATESAPAWSGVFTVTGTAGDIVSSAEPVSVNWTVNDGDKEPVFAQVGSRLGLASIEEPVPVAFLPAEEKVWESSIGGKLEIPVKLKTAGEIKDKLNVRVVELAGLGNKPMQVAIEKGKVEGTLVMQFLNNRDNNKFTAGEHPFLLKASTKVGYRRDVDRATAAEQEKAAAIAAVGEAVKARDEAKKALDAARASAETAAEKAKRIADADAAFKAALEVAKNAETAKAAAEARAKAANERAKPRDLLVENLSAPMRLKLAATPLKVTLPAEPASVAKGATFELPVSIERLYGFAEAVNLSVKLPDGTKGLKIHEASIGKDAGEGKLAIEALADAQPGEVAAELIAKLKFNDIDLEERRPLKLLITQP